MATGERILQIGFEKLILNSAVLENPQLISDLARRFGSQAIIVSIDVTAAVTLLGRYRIVSHSATRTHGKTPVDWAREVERLGAGELLLTAVHREGTWQGFDVALTAQVTQAVGVPVIANGGAGSVADIGEVVAAGGASAVALGSLRGLPEPGHGGTGQLPRQKRADARLESRMRHSVRIAFLFAAILSAVPAAIGISIYAGRPDSNFYLIGWDELEHRSFSDVLLHEGDSAALSTERGLQAARS